MSLSKLQPTRRMALLGGLAAISGCAFTPVYAPGSNASRLRGAIGFNTPETVSGYRLRARLEDRLGRSQTPDFTLNVTLEITQDSVAINQEGDITRFTLPGSAHYTLLAADGMQITQGQVNSFTSYSTTGTTVATRAAADDARDRLSVILADLIITRITALTSL